MLIKSAIELLSELVEWANNKDLEQVVDEIIDILCSCLRTAQFGIYEHAARCLLKIASRKSTTRTETPIVVSMFQDASMHAILTATR